MTGAAANARKELLSRLGPADVWTGELSSSALATAAAVAALRKAGVPVPEDKETASSCAQAAIDAIESDVKPGSCAVISS